MKKIIFEQITKVRNTGKTNMFDVNAVMRIAFDNNWFELADWLSDRNNCKEYTELIFSGKPKLED